MVVHPKEGLGLIQNWDQGENKIKIRVSPNKAENKFPIRVVVWSRLGLGCISKTNLL